MQMGSRVNDSKARQLLVQAAAEGDRLTRHLLVAAALREVLAQEPIVVGGTAEELYTAAGYHETDLDLVGWLTKAEEQLVADLGFVKWVRHWVHEASKVPVEFPESRLAGDESRVQRRRVGNGTFAVIGVDDLYLDRGRQATPADHQDTAEIASPLAPGA